jgi:hypothetical protein
MIAAGGEIVFFATVFVFIALSAREVVICCRQAREVRLPEPVVEPFTAVSLEGRRGRYIALAVVTCNRCLVEHVREMAWNHLEPEYITNIGWRRFGDPNVWLCPDCAQQVGQIIQEVIA